MPLERPTDPDALLDAGQVARYLGIDRKTVRRMVERGEFPAPLKIGRTQRWRWGKIAEFLRALELVQEVKRGQERTPEGDLGTSAPPGRKASSQDPHPR